MTERIVISVSQNAVVQAESAILGCSECAPGATTPFWQIVDKIRNPRSMSRANVVYILPVLASCPNCRSQVDEITLVEPAAGVTAPPIPMLLETRVAHPHF
jgi:hypothetical protein